jgi:Ca-activated chloride channel family protein
MDSENFWSIFKHGLITIIENHQVPVPLKKVRCDVKVQDYIAHVSLVQEFLNEEDHPIEVHYSYPVEESATVVGFEALMDDLDIVGVVKDKERAKDDYDRAVRVSSSLGSSK